MNKLTGWKPQDLKGISLLMWDVRKRHRKFKRELFARITLSSMNLTRAFQGLMPTVVDANNAFEQLRVEIAKYKYRVRG